MLRFIPLLNILYLYSLIEFTAIYRLNINNLRVLHKVISMYNTT